MMKLPFLRSRGLGRSAARSNPGLPVQPIEVGIVRWERELDIALADAATAGKPVFALFQEVPGCAGCRQFGRDVLSHPVVVDAIETAFVPLLIHNNTPGRDAVVLAAYGEPAWNYQVVRFLDAAGHDIIERKDRVWETGPLAVRMIDALERHHAPVPAALRLLEQEHGDRLQSLYLVQGCFWVGEQALGQIDGVVTTEAGFVERHEVTHVRFDPSVITAAQVVAEGGSRGVVTGVYADAQLASELRAVGVEAAPLPGYRVAPASDQKRQLRGVISTNGMTLGQATKVNSFARHDQPHAASYLARRQRAALGWLD